jgi:hypothetical protein
MRTRSRTPAAVVLFTGALALVACGGDARSEGAPGGERLDADMPGQEVSPPEDMLQPGETVVATELPAEEAPAAEAAPATASRPTPAPAPRTTEIQPQRTEVTPPPPLHLEPAADLAPSDPVPAIPVGTEVGGELVTALSTETSRPGDRFSARVQEDVLAANGMVLVPRGSEIRGRVTESRESPGADEPAVIRLAVDVLVIDGREIPVAASVVEAQVRAEARDSGTRTAAKVATGAAAGAVVGRILGRDARSTTAGAVAGAAAGTAVALATRDGQAVMEPGSRIVIRLDQPVWEH